MDTKTVYGYAANGKYTHDLTLDNTDKAPVTGAWLIPANYTETKPPKEKEGFDRVWNGKKWEYVEIPQPEPTPEPTLDELKAQKISELKMHRDTEEVAPVTTDKGIFDYDDKSRDRLYIARQALTDAGGKDTITWTTADNQRVPLGVADFAAINAAAATRSNALHVKYNSLKDEVNAAQTKEDVEKIVWDEGGK